MVGPSTFAQEPGDKQADADQSTNHSADHMQSGAEDVGTEPVNSEPVQGSPEPKQAGNWVRQATRKLRPILLRIGIAGWLAYIITQALIVEVMGTEVFDYPWEQWFYTGALALTAFGAAYWQLRRTSERASTKTRNQLTHALGSEPGYVIHFHGNAARPTFNFDQKDDQLDTSGRLSSGQQEALHDDAEQKLLIQMYSERLGQARTWFICSVFFGFIGSVILLTGISLAVFHANTSGQRYAAIVTSAAGVVPNVLALLLFRQSNLAQRMMATQVEQLREVTREKRYAILHQERLNFAVDLIEKIDSSDLRDAQRAGLVQELVAEPFNGTTGGRRQLRRHRSTREQRNGQNASGGTS
ncbi:hypothetical protein ABIA35_007654 [Catenulispora sp. MAP12-49]|uniref:TRADD-N-associated membrane domain-containing protein n=1 Tax=Catenulispora sp. MAP12-49 TaxID=3156302 RepID=UPI00351859B7